MKDQLKKYCYTCPYNLPSDSLLQKIRVKDVDTGLNIDKPIQVFIGNINDETYELLIKVDQDGKINQLIYKTDRSEKINSNIIRNEALEIILRSLRCLRFAFIGLYTWKVYESPVKDDHINYLPLVEILNYETNERENLIGAAASNDSRGLGKISLDKILSLDDICKVLKVRQEISIHIDIDEYIERFLSIENLSADPVLHLVTLYSLYEYIKGSKGSDLSKHYFKKINKNGSNINLENVFSSTRHLVAHGFAGGKGYEKTAELLKEFLGESNSKGYYSFDRYNSKHINLINEVISESQTVIEKYLKHKLKIGL